MWLLAVRNEDVLVNLRPAAGFQFPGVVTVSDQDRRFLVGAAGPHQLTFCRVSASGVPTRPTSRDRDDARMRPFIALPHEVILPIGLCNKELWRWAAPPLF